ncbi:MAG: cyclohexanecarboxyl-CoA dehydrogenase [Proteobacteria bacterium]|nr:cyclohexanecarboxyl-CoA dehydrogenase [Pseudomonadota bacterium]
MDFSLTQEQQAMADTARRFAQQKLKPGYRSREAAGCIERTLIQEMGALGFLGAELPQAQGGLGADCVTSGLLLEEISAGDFNVGYLNLLVSLCGQIIATHATPDTSIEWLPQVIAGTALPALALTEPHAGSDAARLKLKARADGDDYLLDGEKTSISLATQADIAVVFVRTGAEADGAKGISAFLVDLNSPGISRSAFDDLGSRAVGRGSIFFDGVRVPRRHLLGEANRGFVQVMHGFDYSRALIGLQCLALARTSLDETWRYCAERHAFGKALTAFQGVTFPLAECETQYQAARWLCLRTLWLRDQGLPHSAEAAMCKWWAPKLAAEIVQQCLLTHGHGGYSSSLPFEQRLRDVLGLQIGDGTAQIMKMIIARHMTGAA